MKVVIVDVNDIPVSIGGGSQYLAGAAVATPAGNQVNWDDAGIQRAVSAAKPLPVNVVAGGTSGTQYADGATAATPTGTALAWNDAGTERIASAAKPLPVNIVAGSTAGPTDTDDTSIAAGQVGALSLDLPQMFNGSVWVRQTGDSNGLDVDVTRLPALPAGTNNIGDVDVLTLPSGTLAGATKQELDLDTGAGTQLTPLVGIALPASGGPVAGGTSANPIRTDTTGSTTQPISAASLPLPTSASTSANQATGNASVASIDGKTPALGQALAAAAVPVVLTAIQVTALTPPAAIAGFALETGGNLAAAAAALGATSGAAVITDAAGTIQQYLRGIIKLAITAGGWLVTAVCAGDVAHDGVDSGNPVKMGAQARTTIPTPVADADRVNVICDKIGRQIVVPHAPREFVGDQSTTITASTSATTIVTALATIFLDLVSLTLSNISATATEVILYDDDGTTVRWSGYVPAGDMRGIVFAVPLTQPTVNKTWKLKTVTSVTSVKVTAQFVKNF